MISILMPVYNVEKYLEKTLESVKAQTYTDFEVIMVDDGSTDSSGTICDKWAAEDSRFRVVHTENRGVSAARNTGLSLVKGDYIFCLDSDDLILPETLEELLDNLIKYDADMSCGNILHVDPDGNPIDEFNERLTQVNDEVLTRDEYMHKLCEMNAGYYCHTTHNIYKKAVFDGISFPEGRIHEDHARIHEIIYNCNRIVTSSKRYYLYVRHDAGITGTTFSPKNLAREEALKDRVDFFIKKGLDSLVEETAIYALDAAIVNFTNCVTHGYYYGEHKRNINSYISFFSDKIAPFGKLTSFYKKVATIAWIINRSPELYAGYVDFFFKLNKFGIGEVLKEKVFAFIMKFLSVCPAKKRIIFESHPEMTCNTYPVYRYLLEKGLNEKYEFVWISNDAAQYKEMPAKNVSFITNIKHAKSFMQKIKFMYYISTAKALVYSNQLLGTHGKGKISLWLQHGMPLKASNGTYCINDRCTAALCESEFFADNFSADARVSKDKMIFLGFPRNDFLNKDNDSIAKFGFEAYDKIIFWLPTFRQRKDTAKNAALKDFEMENHGTGIPAIETAEDMIKVNEYLKSVNCLLVLKPHPVQDMSVVSEKGLSNFFIINDSALKEKGVQLYELLGRCDAMITDYSSVYYDYLLTDKPMGLTIGDIDEYIAKRGFVYKNPLEILKGEYIYDTDGLITFLSNVKNGNDVAKEERTAVKNMIHTNTDGNSAQLVGDYIISQLG